MTDKEWQLKLEQWDKEQIERDRRHKQWEHNFEQECEHRAVQAAHMMRNQAFWIFSGIIAAGALGAGIMRLSMMVGGTQ